MQEVQFFLEHLHSDVEELETSVVVLSLQLFLRGRLLTEDGASLPFCVEKEVICFPSQFTCLLHFVLALINSYIQIRLWDIQCFRLKRSSSWWSCRRGSVCFTETIPDPGEWVWFQISGRGWRMEVENP